MRQHVLAPESDECTSRSREIGGQILIGRTRHNDMWPTDGDDDDARLSSVGHETERAGVRGMGTAAAASADVKCSAAKLSVRR